MFHPARGYVSPPAYRRFRRYQLGLRRRRRHLSCHAFSLGRLRGRDLLHILLVVTAIYFFVGWFHEPTSNALGQGRITVWRDDIKQTVIMDIEEYVKGVVAAEMPADFDIEALKAQAVASRTFAVNAIQSGKSVEGHPGAVVSTDHRVSQAWISESEMRRRYGFLDFYWRWRKVSRAVEETQGYVLTYQGDPIFAAYHADSGGRTENSENYWSTPLPYLRSVVDQYAEKQPTTEILPLSTLKLRVGQIPNSTVPALASRSHSGAEVEVLERYPSGRVKWVQVGERIVSGRALREALGLRSNWFDVSLKGSSVSLSVRGYGHGVGMSQVGADGYAKHGATYDTILTHYYQGVQLTKWY